MAEPIEIASDKATLSGVAAKIERADEHIATLDAEVSAFLREHYRIVGALNLESRKYTFTAFGGEVLPHRFAVIIGEVVHHLRSALDHLVTQLQFFGQGDGKPEVLEFPICATAKQFDDACRRGKLRGIPEIALKTIEALQPYRTSNPIDSSPLWVLHDLDRIDKHRLLLLVVACVQMANTFKVDGAGGPATITGMSPPIASGVRPAKEGKAIFDIDFEQCDPNVKVESNFGFEITFDQPGILMNLPVMRSLKHIRETIAVNVIQQGFFPQFRV